MEASAQTPAEKLYLGPRSEEMELDTLPEGKRNLLEEQGVVKKGVLMPGRLGPVRRKNFRKAAREAKAGASGRRRLLAARLPQTKGQT